jgi:hypothetical protein
MTRSAPPDGADPVRIADDAMVFQSTTDARGPTSVLHQPVLG